MHSVIRPRLIPVASGVLRRAQHQSRFSLACGKASVGKAFHTSAISLVVTRAPSWPLAGGDPCYLYCRVSELSGCRLSPEPRLETMTDLDARRLKSSLGGAGADCTVSTLCSVDLTVRTRAMQTKKAPPGGLRRAIRHTTHKSNTTVIQSVRPVHTGTHFASSMQLVTSLHPAHDRRCCSSALVGLRCHESRRA